MNRLTFLKSLMGAFASLFVSKKVNAEPVTKNRFINPITLPGSYWKASGITVRVKEVFDAYGRKLLPNDKLLGEMVFSSAGANEVPLGWVVYVDKQNEWIHIQMSPEYLAYFTDSAVWYVAGQPVKFDDL